MPSPADVARLAQAYATRYESLVMALTGSQKRRLRGLAHHLTPVVQIGKAGVTEPLLQAAAQALLDHELIKVRLPQVDRNERRAIATDLETRTGAELAGLTGRIAIVYRPHPEKPTIALSRPSGRPT